MKFSVNQQDLQQALNYCQGVIEKRGTLPILSNILLNAINSKLILTATDLDIIFIHQINNVEVFEEGKTTTTSSTLYDIIRKFSSGKKINFNSIRKGEIIGEHEVTFSSGKEIITLNHEAFDRALYSEGAITAAKWLINKKPGLYSMRNLLNFK